MKRKRVLLGMFGLTLCFVLNAQTSSDTQAPATDNQAENQTVENPSATHFPHEMKSPPPQAIPPQTETPGSWGGYDTRFAVEVGGRALSQTGNEDVYATYVNLQPGVRLLDQSLEMHSANHSGLLFDDLSEGAFGLGGDPNQAVLLRADKNHWYDFSGNWRRTLNFWDYNLLGNPLNAPGYPQINVSPALFDLARKMLDLNLTLLPQSKVYFVLGYSHYNNSGSSLTTNHQGTEAVMTQPWRDISDSYHFGASWAPAEGTRFTYDQFYTHNKTDTNDYLNSFPSSLSNGTPVNLGIVYTSSIPCSQPFTGGFVSPNCNLFTGYSNTSPYYTDIPTEQIGFQTSYFPDFQITGQASYTGAETHMPNSAEIFNGFTSKSSMTQSIETGSATIQQITTTADFGITYQVSERMWIDDQFRWYAYRIPSGASFLQTYLYSPSALIPANTFPSAACPAPYTAAGCPQHTSNSGADESTTNYSMFQSQNRGRNTAALHYNFTANISGYAGYRFEHQNIVLDGTASGISTYFPKLANRDGCTPVNGVCQISSLAVSSAGVQINANAGLIGMAAKLGANLRLNGDVEMGYADNVFSNIMPRHWQLYRAKANYTPKKWLDLNANLRIQESRNLADGLGNQQHNRSFTFSAAFPFSTRWGLDANYTYDNFLSNINICFSQSPTPAFATTTAICPVGYLTALSFYHYGDSFGSGNIFIHPLPRTSVTAGYTLTSTTGSSLLLNPYAPLGPASVNYHLPSATLAVDVFKHLTFKAGWNLYDYIEKSPPMEVLPRNFRANLLTLSLRYDMGTAPPQ